MKLSELQEDGRIVKGVNTTADVGPNEIKKQAAKFGNSVDKDGRPPTLSKKVKGSKTNVLFNLGLAEDKTPRYTAQEWALMEGGHSIEDAKPNVFENIYEDLFEEFKNQEPTVPTLTTEAAELAMASEIYVDMDGVLADFFTEWGKLMGKDNWRDIGIEQIPAALEKIRQTENFWLDLPLTSNAKALLSLIKDVKGSYNICSSPLPGDPNSKPHKLEWIKKNLNFFPPKDIIITHDKAKYATTVDGTPNILIDDYGKNIKQWEAAGGVGFKHKDHKFERTAKELKQHMNEPASEDAPPGREKQVKALKKKFDDPGAPYAIAWAQHNKHGKPKKKESVQEGITLQFQRGDEFDTLHIKPKGKNRVELRGKSGYESGGYDAQDKLHQVLDKLGKAANFAELMNGEVVTINPKHPDGERAKKTAQDILSTENFADGKRKGKSRPGRVKRSGASCKGSVTSLRKRAKKASGERAKMYHWCANMKSGRKKK